MNLATIKRIVRDCQTERAEYPSFRDWFLRLYDRLLNRWRFSPLPFRKSICRIRLRSSGRPFFLRLGSSDWQVLNEIFLHDEYEALAKCDLEEARWIVDLGSNIGLSVRLWQERYSQARIIAVEPDAENMRMLRLNVPEFQTGQVYIEKACVLGRARPVHLQQGDGEWAFSVAESAGQGVTSTETLAALTMPELLEKYCPDAPIDLLKCDIEGSEAELFRDCGSWLRKVRFVVVELHGAYRLRDLANDVSESKVPIEVIWSEERTDVSLVIFKTTN